MLLRDWPRQVLVRNSLNERDVVDIEIMEDNLSMLVLDDLKNISLGILL